MTSYRAAFAKGSAVRIAVRETLEAFRRDWRFHHPLSVAQLEEGGRAARISSVAYYHGGDVLYELDGVVGIWHEACLASDVGPASATSPPR